MQLLQTPTKSPQQNVSPSGYVPFSRNAELSTYDGPSRHDEQMLNVRVVPADPYAAWLDQREADRRSAGGCLCS
jgi:hypothetical protein